MSFPLASPTSNTSALPSGINTPSRPSGHVRKNSSSSGGSGQFSMSALSPGGPTPEGFSYLSRSASISTPTRRQPVKGLARSDHVKKRVVSSPAAPESHLTRSTSSPADSIALAAHADDAQHEKPLPSTPSSNALAAEDATADRISRGQAPRRSKTLSSFPPFRVEESQDDRRSREAQTLAMLVSQLPANPKAWTPSQVALYLSHVLGLTPRPIVEDVTNYVRSSRMGGRVFLRLREEDLEAEGLNFKWRKLMVEAVRKLRRDCLRGRIFGFGGGSWGRAAGMELGEAVGELDVESTQEQQHGTARPARRGRSGDHVQGIVRAIESGAESADEGDGEAFVALGHGAGHRLSGSGSGSGSSGEHPPAEREAMRPIYGAGFVARRAASFSNIAEVARGGSGDDTDEWLGYLSERDAEATASELDESDLRGYGDTEESDFEDEAASSVAADANAKATLKQNANADASDLAIAELGYTRSREASATSACSADDAADLSASIRSEVSSAATSPPPPAYSPIAADVSRATVTRMEPQLVDGVIQPAPGPALGLDDLDEELDVGGTAKPTKRGGHGTRRNPYRASTWDQEEQDALPAADDSLPRFGTARRRPTMPAPSATLPSEDLESELGAEGDTEPDAVGTVKPRSQLNKKEGSAHMENMQAHLAMGNAPYARLGRRSSQRSSNATSPLSPRSPHSPTMSSATSYFPLVSATAANIVPGGADGDTLPELPESKALSSKPTSANTGTMGSKRAKGMAALLRSAGGATAKLAEDEERWGETLSRGSARKLVSPTEVQGEQSSVSGLSRKNVPGVLLGLFEPGDAAPAPASNQASTSANAAETTTPAGSVSDAAPAVSGAVSHQDQIAVPLTTLEPNPDGRGSIKKRSMVLVERKRFESLARRMGVLEAQLAALDNVPGSPPPGLDDVDNDVIAEPAPASGKRSLVDAFAQAERDEKESPSAVPVSAPTTVTAPEPTTVEYLSDEDEEDTDAWAFRLGNPKLTLGAIPSYMLGLGAGIGFVVLSEVVGRAARIAGR